MGLVATLVGLLAVAASLNAPARVCHSLAEAQLDANRFYMATEWLRWAEWFGGEEAMSHLLLARAYRWRGATARAMEEVQAAARLGAPRKRIREHTDSILARRGDLEAAARLMEADVSAPRDAFDSIARCAMFHAEADWAASLLDQWESDFPTDAMPNYLRGRLAEVNEEAEQAVAFYETALQRQSGFAPAAFRRGMLLKAQRDFTAARTAFLGCFETPIERIARTECADTLTQLGEYDEAWDLLSPTLDANPSEAMALYLEVDEFVEDDRSAVIAGRVCQGRKAYDQAVTYLRRALEFNRRNIEVRSRLAACLRRLGRTDEASEQEAIHRKQVAQRAQTNELLFHLAEDPDDLETRCDLADLYQQCDSLAAAQLELKTVLARDPDHARAHKLLASVYREKAEFAPEYRALVSQHEEQSRRAVP